MRFRGPLSSLVLIQALVVQPAVAADVAAGSPVAVTPPFTANDLLWMEVRVGDQQLAETMDVYSSRAGVFVPLGQFARILDLSITILPPELRAEGWILSPDRRFVLNLRTLNATVGNRVIAFDVGQAVLYQDDIYIRADLAEKLLPLRLRPDPAAQLLTVIPTEPLPFEQKAERAQLRRGLSASRPERVVVSVPLPYKAISTPLFDVNIGGQAAREPAERDHRYSIRAASDLAYAGFRGFVGSDENGKINDARVSLERKSPDGHALGMLGGIRAAIGDVFSPSSALGASSTSGRGIYYSSAPLESVDLSTPVNLRGELQLGEEVELYVNETLRAAQSTPEQGRYEFLDVPLSLGMNVIRLVFYGAQGQRREQVRRINLGAGQVEAGQLVTRFGAVQQDRTVIELGNDVPDPARGALRAFAGFDYGVSSKLTASAGMARYTPRGGPARSLGFSGLRGALGSVAAQGDIGIDNLGGRGATLGLAARPLGISILTHHSEYGGGFVDETRQFGVNDDLVLRRASDLRADASFRIGKGTSIPVSLNVQRLERSDDSIRTNWSARAAAPVRSLYVSTSVSYDDDTNAPAGAGQLLSNLDISTLVTKRVQVRGGLSYQFRPLSKIDSVYALADIVISPTNRLHLGVTRSAGPYAETNLQASHLYSAKRFDIATSASYDARSRRWRLGFQLAFSIGPDPITHRYAIARPGAATGGAVALDAFVDANGDGIRQTGEAPVRGVEVQTPSGEIMTGAQGRAAIGNLGDPGKVVLEVNADNTDDPFLSGAPHAYEIVPRPGRVARIEIPMHPSSEVELTAMVRRELGAERPLSALNVELVPKVGGAPIGARTDHAGVVIFESVRAGEYDVRLQPSQANGLGLTLSETVHISVPVSGGYVRAGKIVVGVRKASGR